MLALMTNRASLSLPTIAVALCLAGVSSGCLPTSHSVAPTPLGVAGRTSSIEAVLAQPGPITVETVIGADWAVGRDGMINLAHPKAVAAHLDDGLEPIYIAFHALRHPTRGVYLVDTGVERALRDDPRHPAVRGVVASVLHTERMTFRIDTRTWIEREPTPPAGVFLTHLHVDHVSGLRDVPAGTPVYVGKGETTARTLENLFVAPIVDDALVGKATLQEWQFAPDPDGAFEGVVDIFGDGTVCAISVPGHTPGSTAFLARTAHGPVLLVGDACHTAWGWDHGVEPGTFSVNKPKSRESLERLQRFVAKHPEIEVRLGHQAMTR